MPKLKTHKGTKKVLNVRDGGSITIGHPSTRHNTGKKNSDISRKNRKGSALSNSDKRRLKTVSYK